MKIYILTDLEGVAGVARWNQTGPDKPGYAQAVRLMTEELRACVAGIKDAAPQAEIWVWDAHGPGSIDVERFPRGAKLLNNGPMRPPAYLDESFDALFFLGQHAKAGTPDANLAHTYSSETIFSYTINDLELGEFGCRAAMAGAMGVPTVFVSGDDKMMTEARELVPDIHGAQVKVGLGMEMALHLAPEDARDLIKETAAEAMDDIDNIEPLVISGPPYEQVATLIGRASPNRYLDAGFRQVGDRRYAKSADRLEDLLI